MEEIENYITIDDFDKIKLEIGEIVNSEKVEGADKLLKNTIRINNELKTIVSGIAKTYKPEDIIGKQVVVVTNLKPRLIRNIESQGMVLCAVDDKSGELSLISPMSKMPDGSIVC